MILYARTMTHLPSPINYNIVLYFSLICVSTTAYRPKTTKSYRLTRPVRTTTEKSKVRAEDDDDYNEMDEEVDDVDREKSMEEDDKNEDTDWFDDLKNDPQFADEEVDLATGTPIDLETYTFTERTSITDSTKFTTTVPTSTTLMDLKVIGFNETWCTYVKKTNNCKLEGEAFVELVKKLCSGNHAEDNDVRLAMRHTLENRRVIDRLFDDIILRLAGDDQDKKEKLLKPKHKISPQNEFCYNRIVKSFKYVCFDPELNPYMQRYLKIIANACRMPELNTENIREHLVEACDSINYNLVDVV